MRPILETPIEPPVDTSLMDVQELVRPMKTDKPVKIEETVDDDLRGDPRLSIAVYSERPKTDTPVYPEEVGDIYNIDRALNESSHVKNKLKTLGQVLPAERADIGAKFGAGTGFAVGGPVGALVGAGVGAIAGRALGLLQSGEAEDQNRTLKSVDSLSSIGVIGENRKINFGEGLGESPEISFDPAYKLQNTSSVAGKAERTIFEIDKSNPFTQRSLMVSKPLGYFVSSGLLGYGDFQNPRDLKTADKNTALFVNSLTSDADNIELIYGRAKSLTKKLGITEEQMRTFIETNKSKFSEAELPNLLRGVDILYA